MVIIPTGYTLTRRIFQDGSSYVSHMIAVTTMIVGWQGHLIIVHKIKYLMYRPNKKKSILTFIYVSIHTQIGRIVFCKRG